MINQPTETLPDAGRSNDSVLAAPQQAQQRLDAHRSSTHAGCIVCGCRADHLPRVEFTVADDQSVQATVLAGDGYEGYAGLMHGGVIATLLDAAMTNCLFAQGHRAVTADLHVRYRHPVASEESSEVRAWIKRENDPLFVLQAELRQAGKLLVTATGKFMRIRPDHPAEANLHEQQ